MFKLFCISLNYLIVLAQYMPSSLLEYLEISCSVATRSGFAPMPMLQNVVCKKNRLSNTTVFYKKTAITYMYPLHIHWFWRVTWFIPKRDIAFSLSVLLTVGTISRNKIFIYFFVFLTSSFAQNMCNWKFTAVFFCGHCCYYEHIIHNLWYHWKNNYIVSFQTCLQILVRYSRLMYY